MATLQRLALRGTPKATKAAARYTPAGGAERCGMCRHYVPSSSCARIEGPVSAAGWCQLYSQQVTWRPRAGQDAGLNTGVVPSGVTLDLSFMAPGSLDPRITFTRASTGTYFDSTGTMQTAATNAPRWDYNPTTHVLNGLLVEEARTNLCLWSADISNAAWAKVSFSAALVVTANASVAPDGTTTASSVAYPAIPAAGNYGMIAATFTATAAIYTSSIWLKGAVGGETLYISFDNTASTQYYTQAVTLTTAWRRFSVTSAALTAATWFFQIGSDRRDALQGATPAQTIFVWGGHIEQGGFATSYIPTAAANVTRSADLASMPTAPWYNTTTSSLSTEIACPVLSPANVYQSLVCIDDGTISNRVEAYRSTAGNAVFSIVGASNQSIGSLVPGAVTKAAIAYRAGFQHSALNGVIAGADTQALPTGLTTLRIGSESGGTALLNGYARRVRYWPRVLTDAELQSVTT